MTKTKPFDERIRRASCLAVRARVNLDLFAFLKWQKNLDKYEDVLLPRWNLFDFIRTANEHEFVARIVNLFTKRPDTDNFPSLANEAEHFALIDPVTCAAIKVQIAETDDTFGRVKTIRHKVVSHQDDTQTKPQIYKRVKPTLPMFIELSDQSLSIANALCAARGVTSQAVFSAPIDQLEEMLTELQKRVIS